MNVWERDLCTSTSYEQFSLVGLAISTVKGKTRGLCPLHNYRFFNYSNKDSVALKRHAGVSGFCRRASAFSLSNELIESMVVYGCEATTHARIRK